MPDEDVEYMSQDDVDKFIRRRQSMADAIAIANVNRTAEVQKILSDAKRILSFYEKGPVE